jgi:uncharacterized protein (DUF952 family)
VKVIHITSRKAWMDARNGGLYSAPSLAAEGFIHCSTTEQVLPVARKFYRSQTGLVLLVIDPARLTSTVKWEPPADGLVPSGLPAIAVFPHIHGPINVEAVVQVLDFDPDANGEFNLPAALTVERPRDLS